MHFKLYKVTNIGNGKIPAQIEKYYIFQFANYCYVIDSQSGKSAIENYDSNEINEFDKRINDPNKFHREILYESN